MNPGAIDQWVVNAVEPSTLARFWAFLLGGEPVDRPDGRAFVEGTSGAPRLSFQPTPEPKARPNRVHLDVRVSDIAEVTERLRERGAVTVGDVVIDEQGAFQVLLDPEGNEFCLVRPAAR